MSYPFALPLACLLALALPAHAALPLSLDEALSIAAREAPQLTAQAASIRAARETSVTADQLPDPKLRLSLENLPSEGADRFSLTASSMTSRRVALMQEFTRSEKLTLRTERALAAVQKEELQLAATETNLRRAVALAWTAAWFAERRAALLEALQDEQRLQITAADAALAGGRSNASAPYAARMALAALGNRVTAAQNQAARARATLGRWIGDAATRPLAALPDLAVSAEQQRSLFDKLQEIPQVALFAPMQGMAESEVKLAQAEKRPDWNLEMAYAERGSAFTNMFSIGVTINLPIFQSSRQDPAIAAKVAMADQVRAQADAAEREYRAEIGAQLADWNAAQARGLRYTTELLPLAREQAALTLAAYRGGNAELMTVIAARKAEIDIQLEHLAAQADAAQAWSQLNYLIPATTSKANP